MSMVGCHFAGGHEVSYSAAATIFVVLAADQHTPCCYACLLCWQTGTRFAVLR